MSYYVIEDDEDDFEEEDYITETYEHSGSDFGAVYSEDNN